MSSIQNLSPLTLFKSENLWIVNKPIRCHYDEIMPQSGTWEPVHRLDFETSGCLIFAPGPYIEVFRQRIKLSQGVRKTYYAGGSDSIPLRGREHVHGYVGSRYRSSKKVKFSDSDRVFQGYHSVVPCEHKAQIIPASSIIKALSPDLEATRRLELEKLYEHSFEVELISGARHQIRAYFEFMRSPLKGDPIYNPNDKTSSRMALHARSLEIQIESGDKPILVEAPLI